MKVQAVIKQFSNDNFLIKFESNSADNQRAGNCSMTFQTCDNRQFATEALSFFYGHFLFLDYTKTPKQSGAKNSSGRHRTVSLFLIQRQSNC